MKDSKNLSTSIDSRIKKVDGKKAAAREGGCRSSLSNCRIAIELNIRGCAGLLWARLGQTSLFGLVYVLSNNKSRVINKITVSFVDY